MWLVIAILAYFINAGVYTADKFILSRKIHSSVVYAFMVGVWSVFNLVLLPIDPWVPSFPQLMLDLSGGFLFLIAMIAWYKALHQSEATRVVPVVGALTPIFSFLLSYLFLGEAFDFQQMMAFIILVIGGVLISIKQPKTSIFDKFTEKFTAAFGNILGEMNAELRPVRRILINSAISAFCFASYYVLMKYIYLNQPFVGSFVWSRMGTFIGALLIFVVPMWRRSIIEHQKSSSTPENIVFFFSVRFLAAMAFIMLNWAISLGNVAMVNALQGTQYLFLIILVLVVSARYPHLLKEEMGKSVLLQKIMGILLVSLGLYVLVF